jgi:hypothetical protein
VSVLFAVGPSDRDTELVGDVETPAPTIVKWWRADRIDSAIAKHTQIKEKNVRWARTPAISVAAAVAPSFLRGRSRTNRAAIASASDGFPMLAEIRSNVETNVFSATSFGIAANRAASSHGSTLVRAKAERTLRRIPLASSQTGANKNSSYFDVGLKVKGRLSTGFTFDYAVPSNMLRFSWDRPKRGARRDAAVNILWMNYQ